MEEKKLKELIAQNISHYRKKAGLTQAMLAEQLNYSDKSVSKWERGDGLPDIGVLIAMAEIFGVTLNDLVSEQTEEALDEPAAPEQSPGIIRKNRIVITLLSVGLVWFVASIVFYVLKLIFPDNPEPAYTFLIAVPVSFIVSIVMVSMWWGMGAICTMVSGLVWSLAVCIDVLLPLESSSLIYLVAAVFQVLIVLWYILKFHPDKLRFLRRSDEQTEDKQ